MDPFRATSDRTATAKRTEKGGEGKPVKVYGKNAGWSRESWIQRAPRYAAGLGWRVGGRLWDHDRGYGTFLEQK